MKKSDDEDVDETQPRRSLRPTLPPEDLFFPARSAAEALGMLSEEVGEGLSPSDTCPSIPDFPLPETLLETIDRQILALEEARREIRARYEAEETPINQELQILYAKRALIHREQQWSQEKE